LIFKEISLKPYDCMNDIKRIIFERFADINNPVEEWPEDIEIYVKGPLAVKNNKEEDKNEWDLDE